MADEPSVADRGMSIWAHIDELRGRLVVCLAVLGVGTAVGLAESQAVLAWLRRPLDAAQAATGVPLKIIATSPIEVFTVAFKASLLVGLGAAVPVILYEVFRFIDPALRAIERRAVYPVFAVSSVLFYAGVAAAYAWLMPWTFRVLLLSQKEYGIDAYWTLSDVFSTEVGMLFATGILCEVPVAMAALGKMGILSPSFLRGKIRIILFLSALFSAWITPTGDPFTMGITLAILLGFVAIGWLSLWIFAKK